MSELGLVVLDIKPGAAFESQSGLQAGRPRIYGALAGPARGRIGAIVMHPTSNLMGHYLLEPLERRGISTLALNSRYAGNDSVLLMERVIQDLGAGVKWMRERFDKVFLIGNSGGASLTAFYAAQAEKLNIKDTPAGDPIELAQDDFPRIDGLALMAAHLGRSRLMAKQIDGSLADERDSLSCDPSLDIYDPAHRIPFDAAFVARVREAQQARIERITNWAKARLKHLRSLPEPIQDEAFVVYRTYADPRFIDLSIDPNDRKAGGNRGLAGGDPRSGARAANYSVNNLARYTSLTAWLSQWSPDSRADGPASLARTSIPVLNLEFTADGSIFPSDIQEWSKACKGREEFHRIQPGTHYLRDQPELIERAANLFTEWAKRKAQA